MVFGYLGRLTKGILTDKAAHAKLFGGTGIGTRVGLMAGYMAPTYVTTKLIDRYEEHQRNYYGSSRYDSYYGSGAGAAKFVVGATGLWFGINAGLGRDPISRTINQIKYRGARSAAKSSGRALNNEISALRNRTGIVGVARGGTGRLRGLVPQVIEGPLPASDAYALLSTRHTSNLDLLSRTANSPRWKPLNIAMGLGKIGTLSGGSAGPLGGYIAMGGAGLLGVGAVVMGGMAIHKAGGKTATAFALAGGVAGGLSAVRNNNPTAEGNIIDFSEYNSSGVSRMNFSTAGLVQALHRNNRRM